MKTGSVQNRNLPIILYHGVAIFLMIVSILMSCAQNGVKSEGSSNRLLGDWQESFIQGYATGQLSHTTTLTLWQDSFKVVVNPSLYRFEVDPERLDLHTDSIEYFGKWELSGGILLCHIEDYSEKFSVQISGKYLKLVGYNFKAYDDGTVSIKTGSFLWDYSATKNSGTFIRR